VVLFVTDFSPYMFEHHLVTYLPFLKHRHSKGILHLIAASLLFDPRAFPHSEGLHLYCGPALIVSGTMWSLYYHMQRDANPSDYRGF
jgi:hypothetical protein